MALNEKTSESVASIAGRILEMNKPNGVEQKLWEDILKIAGSALTQSPDNPKSSLYSKIPIRPY